MDFNKFLSHNWKHGEEFYYVDVDKIVVNDCAFYRASCIRKLTYDVQKYSIYRKNYQQMFLNRDDALSYINTIINENLTEMNKYRQELELKLFTVDMKIEELEGQLKKYFN